MHLGLGLPASCMPRHGHLSMADGSHQESLLLQAGARGLVPMTHFICVSAELVGVLAHLQSITCGSGVSVGSGGPQVLLLRHWRPALARKGWLQGDGSAGCRASGRFLVYFSEEKPWFHHWHED